MVHLCYAFDEERYAVLLPWRTTTTTTEVAETEDHISEDISIVSAPSYRSGCSTGLVCSL